MRHAVKPAATHHGPRWQRRKQARHSEILAAALESFVESGYAATRLDDVARRAGVTKGTMYLYFESKEALFKAVVRESIVPLLEQGEELVAQHQGSASELITILTQCWWEEIGESRLSGIPKLVMAESANFPDLATFYHQEVVERGRELVGRAIRLGIERGEFRAVDVALTVRLLFAPLLLATMWMHSFMHCESQSFDARAFVDLHREIFLRGIAAGALEEKSHA